MNSLIDELVKKHGYDRDEVHFIQPAILRIEEINGAFPDIPSFVWGWQSCKSMAKTMPEDFKRVLNLME